LLRLASELLFATPTVLMWGENSLHDQLPALNVPFLSPSSSDWPAWVHNGVKDANFGYLDEPANAHEVDVVVRRENNIIMSGESKNRDTVDSKVLVPSLKKIPHGSCVHFLFLAALSDCHSNEFTESVAQLARKKWNFGKLEVDGTAVRLVHWQNTETRPKNNKWVIVIICDVLNSLK